MMICTIDTTIRHDRCMSANTVVNNFDKARHLDTDHVCMYVSTCVCDFYCNV